ncbi:metallopeptidase family protein [Georgenia alba]|uniref:Metallopeptidase family protein n=1 Tax=Georgenia alba TaxID=2233858 RepID=A0ABW2Q8U7_9MICO
MTGSQPSVPAVPARRAARRRDRRGRGLRGPLIPPGLPAWRTRMDRFDDVVLRTVRHLEKRFPTELAGVEFAVEEVPPSDPAPWERRTIALGRYFPGDSAAGLTDRIVVYRRPLLARAEDSDETEALVRMVLVEQVAGMLDRDPEDIDPGYPAD